MSELPHGNDCYECLEVSKLNLNVPLLSLRKMVIIPLYANQLVQVRSGNQIGRHNLKRLICRKWHPFYSGKWECFEQPKTGSCTAHFPSAWIYVQVEEAHYSIKDNAENNGKECGRREMHGTEVWVWKLCSQGEGLSFSPSYFFCPKKRLLSKQFTHGISRQLFLTPLSSEKLHSDPFIF